MKNRDSWLSLTMARFERLLIVRLMRRYKGNVTRAASHAGRNRTEFYRVLARHAIDPRVYR